MLWILLYAFAQNRDFIVQIWVSAEVLQERVITYDLCFFLNSLGKAKKK